MAEETADVVKLRTLRWGGYSGLSRWALDNHKDPSKRGRRARVRREMGAEREVKAI